MFTPTGEYYERGYCAECGMPCDSDGDCVNPMCATKDAAIAALTADFDLSIRDLDDDESTK